MSENKELNLEEMNEVSGGYKKPLKKKVTSSIRSRRATP